MLFFTAQNPFYTVNADALHPLESRIHIWPALLQGYHFFLDNIFETILMKSLIISVQVLNDPFSYIGNITDVMKTAPPIPTSHILNTCFVIRVNKFQQKDRSTETNLNITEFHEKQHINNRNNLWRSWSTENIRKPEKKMIQVEYIDGISKHRE